MTYLEVLIILQIKYKIFPIFASTTAAAQCASPGGIALVIYALNLHYTTVHCNSMHMCISAHCSGVQWYAMCIQYGMHCTVVSWYAPRPDRMEILFTHLLQLHQMIRMILVMRRRMLRFCENVQKWIGNF